MLDAGGLIAYGTSLREAARHMAHYADSILQGANPGDLPIRAALSHELVVNVQTARGIGVSVPSKSSGGPTKLFSDGVLFNRVAGSSQNPAHSWAQNHSGGTRPLRG
jgi:hypothetical protein